MTLRATANNSGDPVYYSQGFLNTVADHKEVFRQKNYGSTVSIKEGDLYMLRNDVYRLLSLYGVPPELILVCMLFNDIKSPTEDISQKTTFFLPDATKIAELLSSYKSTHA